MLKATKSRIVILQRLDAEGAKALKAAKATTSYYPTSRTRSKIFNQSAFRGLKFKTVKVNNEDNKDYEHEDEDEDGHQDENEDKNEDKGSDKEVFKFDQKFISISEFQKD